MNFSEWLLFATAGRILIYLWMQFPEPPFMKLPYWLEKLHRCDLCSGFYVYAILALAMHLDLFGTGNFVTQIATGAVTTFLVHIFYLGWNEKYGTVVIN